MFDLPGQVNTYFGVRVTSSFLQRVCGKNNDILPLVESLVGFTIFDLLCNLSYVNVMKFKIQNFHFVEPVHRYYESRRRLFNDNQPVRLIKADESKKRAKKNLLRRQVRKFNSIICNLINLFD